MFDRFDMKDDCIYMSLCGTVANYDRAFRNGSVIGVIGRLQFGGVGHDRSGRRCANVSWRVLGPRRDLKTLVM